MIPKEKVEAIVSKHNSIEKELSSGNIDPKKYVEMSKGRVTDHRINLI